MTKAEEIFTKVNALVEKGTSKAEAFEKLAKEYGQPVDSLRGSYYRHSRAATGGSGTSRPRRTKRRETTPDDAVEDAVSVLQRSIENIDAEIESAKERAEEAAAEYKAQKESAASRKAEIEKKIEALTS